MKAKRVNYRRKVLIGLTGGIAGASQLPSKWTKPVINSVILPAHAQTSATTAAPTTASPTTGGPTTGAPTTAAPTTTTMAPLPTNFRGSVSLAINFASNERESIFSALIPKAYAGISNPTGDLCITSNDGTSFETKLLYDFDGTHFHDGSGSVGGGSTGFPQIAGTAGCFILDANIAVSSISESGADFSIGGEVSAMGTLPVGSGCPSNPGGGCQQSDIRLKTDVQKLNSVVNNHELYRFKYINDPNRIDYVGVMAQDILKTHPEAVTKREDGFYAVYYNQLGLKMTTLEEWRKKGLNAVTTKLQ